jgi:hypothetical protein
MTTIDTEALVTATGGISRIRTTQLPDPQHWGVRAQPLSPQADKLLPPPPYVQKF